VIFGPPDSECVRVAKAVKKALDTSRIVWRELRLMLTKDRILFVIVGEYIDVCDMDECDRINQCSPGLHCTNQCSPGLHCFVRYG